MNKRYKIEGMPAKNIFFKDDSETGESCTYTIVLNVGRKKPQDFWRQIGSYTRARFEPCRDWRDFFESNIDRGRCGHEHDCCGCWNMGLYDVKKIGNKVYFQVHEHMNI